MTFEQFTMAVNYPNREQQFYKYYDSHLALFKLMCQYMDEKSGMDIGIRDTGKRCKYIITLQHGRPGNLIDLANRLQGSTVASAVDDNTIWVGKTSLKDPNVLEVSFN